MDTAYVSTGYQSLLKRVCLVNTFFGLDDAQNLPPNFVVTGPLTKRAELLYPNGLQAKDDKLFSWMGASEDKILYVSLGTQCAWQVWSCQAILEGVQLHNSQSQAPIRVVWQID